MNKMITKPKLLSEFLVICSKMGFFEAAAVTQKSIENLKFLPHTKLLQENIERAAVHTGKNNENSLKMFGDEEFVAAEMQLPLPEKYLLIRERIRSTKDTPFQLVELRSSATPPPWKSMGSVDEKEIFIQLPAHSKSISFSCFVQEKQAQEYFYRFQRQRKIWWMQYAANPGRFFISEVKSNNFSESNQNAQSVSLMATYPFGSLTIENIELLPLESMYPEETRKHIIPNRIIRSSAFLEVAVIETVLDSIDAGDFGEMCIHRKIAPYQCSVYCFAQDTNALRELNVLAKYIKMMLNKHQVSIFNMDESTFRTQSDLQRKFTEMDAIGIPYGLVLDEKSLQNGVMKLRYRDTTLCETIHISYLPQYFLQLFSLS